MRIDKYDENDKTMIGIWTVATQSDLQMRIKARKPIIEMVRKNLNVSKTENNGSARTQLKTSHGKKV